MPGLTSRSKMLLSHCSSSLRPTTFVAAVCSTGGHFARWNKETPWRSKGVASELYHTNPLYRIPRMITPTNPISADTKPSYLRRFNTTPRRTRDHHFDTLKFVQKLEAEGLSKEQAESLMKVLSEVIEEAIQNLTRTMVLREDALKSSYTQKVDFSSLRTELLQADSSEAALTRASHERLTNELQKLNNRLRDEIGRTQASVRLDLNLEKGRIREEANTQEQKMKEVETRIEQEVAGLRERIESVKFSTLQWLMGVCTGTAALLLGAWRLLM